MTKTEFIKSLQSQIKANEKLALSQDDHKTVIRLAAINTTLQEVIELAKTIKE